MVTQTYSPGLEGVVAGTTQICSVSPDGERLIYRGYDVEDLAQYTLYEDTAFLLLNGELPSEAEKQAFRKELASQRKLPLAVVDSMKQFPKDAHGMDTLKATVALLALYDADKNDNSPAATRRKAVRLIAAFPTAVAYAQRLQQGLPIIEPQGDDLSHAENFFYMLHGEKPSKSVAHIFNAILIIYAEHGFNASTFSGRVTVSTLSDIYSGVLGAIGALKGPLHGGANEQAMLTFLEIGSEANVESWLSKALSDKRKIMGFGHRAYKHGDPRAPLLKSMREALLAETGDAPWPAIADKLEALMLEAKGLFPNVDYPIAYLLYMMGLPTSIYTPIFAIGRIAGWASHCVEQLENNRLIRPSAIYEGKPYRPWQDA